MSALGQDIHDTQKRTSSLLGGFRLFATLRFTVCRVIERSDVGQRLCLDHSSKVYGRSSSPSYLSGPQSSCSNTRPVVDSTTTKSV